MKILKITFQNINNLRGGPHIIAFNEPPLDTAGIFAILGPTGSGKSTLLDVITLSLFNRIPRFKKQISKNEMIGLGSVITHHAKDASAAIVYEIEGKQYTSSWSISKTKTGTLKDYEMSLQNEKGEYLDLKRSEVPTKNEEIIGLNYDQFIKSIILSQGEFSRFLKADKSERGKLLENITGTSIYRKIGQQAYQKFKSAKESVEIELHKLGEILVFSDEELAAINNEIEQKSKQIAETEKEVKRLTAIKQVKSNLAELKFKIQEKENAFNSFQIELKDFEPSLQKLAIHDKINPLRGDLTLYLKTKENKIETEKNLQNYEAEIKKATEGYLEAIQQMSELTGEKVDANNFQTVMKAFEKEVHEMDASLKHIQANGKEQRARINNKIQEYPIPVDAKTPATKVLEQLSNHEKQLLKIIEDSPIGINTNIQDAKNKLKTDQQLREKLSALSIQLKRAEEIATKIAEGTKSITKFETQQKNLLPLIDKSQTNLKNIEKIAELLRKQKEDALKIASLEELRAELTAESPCPLCGSLSHPYSDHLPADTRTALEQQMINNQQELEIENKQLKELKDQLVQNTTSISLTQNSTLLLKKEQTQINKSLNEAQKEVNLDSPLDHQEITTKIEKLTAENSALELAIEALGTLKINKELHTGYSEIQSILEKYKTLQEKRNKKYQGPDPSIVCNKLQDEFNTFKTSISENKKAREIESKDLIRANELLLEKSKSLQPKITVLGYDNIEALESLLLSEQLFESLKTKKEALSQKETSLKTELVSLKEAQVKQQPLDKYPTLELEALVTKLVAIEKIRDDLNNNLGALQARLKEDESLRKRRAGKEAAIEKLNKKLARWSDLNHIIGDATGNKFSNFAQGLTLQNLLVFTNKRLRHLSDRYLLNMPGDNGTFRVIDQYQGNTERSVSTLSGGETFIISLALALSLSDMASRNVSLDSLFIDEGFGTLDQETLDVALDTLEALQTESQKTVGVISHVEALKERISVQIKLVKDAQGGSRLEIEG